MIVHAIPPVFDENSTVLILGSFPSVKSRESGFFYGHSQNRFWRVLGGVFGEDAPETIHAKKSFLLSHGIALWDVLASCDIGGSADASIKNPVPNRLDAIFELAQIKSVFLNGTTAKKYYDKFLLSTYGFNAVCLPSTSPANAAYSLQMLIDRWKQIAG